MSVAVFTSNPHDSGYDLVPGSDVTNPRVGKVYYDDAGSAAGLVVALDSGEEDVMESGEEARAWLEARGYALDDASVAAIDALTQATSDA